MRIIICLLCVCIHPAYAQVFSKAKMKPSLRVSLNREFKNEHSQHAFSGVLLVAHKGKPVFYKSVGYRNFARKSGLRKTDVFELASVSKQFTSMIIMMLKERGATNGTLAYDDLLERYIPGLPYKDITLRHLLTHTSGLPDYQSIMDQNWDKSRVADNGNVIDYLKKYPQPIHFKPGEKYEYSNTGYLLLASVVEAATDTNFIELMKRWVFKPTQMTHSGFLLPLEKSRIKNFAKGHVFDSTSRSYVDASLNKASNYTIWLGGRKGPGRISSTALDLLKWDQILYTPYLVAQTTMDEAYKPYTLKDGTISNYGFGWEVNTHLKLGRIVEHSGDNPGYRTHIRRYLDQDYTIILLNNNSSGRMDDILKSTEELIEKKTLVDNPNPLKKQYQF